MFHVFRTKLNHSICSPAEEPLLVSTHHPQEFLKSVRSSIGSSPSPLPVTHYTAFENPDSPGALPSIPEPNNGVKTPDVILFQREHVPFEKSKSYTPSGLLAEETRPLPTASLMPPGPMLGSSPQYEVLAKLSADWNQARTNSAKQSSLFTTPTRSQLQSMSNISLTSLSSSPTTHQVGLNSEQKTPLRKHQDGVSERTLEIETSQPTQRFGPSKLSFAAESKTLDVDQLSPSSVAWKEKNPAHDIKILHDWDGILAPAYNVPLITAHPTSPSSELTEVSPEDFYPTNTMEMDWGSGDYLETMSFLNSDGDDYSLVTKMPHDSYDLEDFTENYDTSFPSRVGLSPSSLHPHHITPSPSLMTTYSTAVPLISIHPSSFSSTIHYTLEPTPAANSVSDEASDIDWPDTFTIQPTDVLLPDMNSLEYYTIQLNKENNSSDTGAEHRGNVTVVSISTTDVSFINDTKLNEEESLSDLSGFEPHEESTVATAEDSPQLANTSEPFLDPSVVSSNFLDPSSSIWGGKVSTVSQEGTVLTETILPHATPLLPDDIMFSSSLTDVHWFVTESFLQSTIYTTPVLTETIAFSPVPTEPSANTSTNSSEPTSNVTLGPPVVLDDQGVTEEGVDMPATMTLIPTSSEANTVSTVPTTTTVTTTSHQAPTRITVINEASTSVNIISNTDAQTTITTPAPRQYLCSLEKPAYLVKIDFPYGATGFAKSQIKDILKVEFNKSVELQVVDPSPKFVFRVVSGQVIYTAISVINALQRFRRRYLSVSPIWTVPDNKYQVHTVLQFVPGHVDVRLCNFSESMEKGLTMAFAEVCQRAKESTNFTVHIINITMASPKYQEQQLVRQPVDIIFTVSGPSGYLLGSEVSNGLMKLTMVEFSYYMGFPVLQIAEPFHYPELNTSQTLRSSWVRTVLLGVLDQKVGERTFQANMERRVAMLIGEAMGLVRRVKRATTIGNSSVQVVSATRLHGLDHPLEIVYFVEGPSGQRMTAVETTNILNRMDVQRAAIVLGYRVQGILAQPVEKVTSSPSDTETTNMWIVIGVVIPLLVVIVIISILYWKLCRTDKLEFQPDAMTSMQQRQKLQAPSVKGFDFAKLHLGQQSKDDVMVIQEPVPPEPGLGPLSIKDGLSPSENGEIPTPIFKTSASSTKASRSSRRRGRISPSDGDSVISDHSSERESTEENLRAHATPSDSKQTRKVPINVLNGPPPMNGTSEQLSSASIFEHVDRMSRTTDASRRLPNKVQLIAMQPMPVPPLHSPPINGKLSDTNQINKEIQVALRHKSEIEHHRNKIRLRAKRKGHYDFPAMDDITSGFRDVKDQDCIYQKAQTQIDKILDPDAQMPSIFMESKKSGRGRRSPKQRMKEQLNGGMMEADKDHLITEDSDAAYRKCPGVNNVAYVSDPDQGPGSPHRSPSPIDDVFLGPTSSPPGHAPPPPPYLPPQPSIEEARQQMHSLLDDAFALVSPTSQGSTAGITLPGVNSNALGSSPPGRSPRPWGSSYQALSPFPGRFSELGMSPSSVQGLTPRQGLGSSYMPTGETAGHGEQFQPDSLYSSRGLYADELPSSARPRPVGGTTGAQLHHLTQVGLSSRMNGYPAGMRMARSGTREPSAPPAHLDPSVVGYLSVPPPLDTSPPTHSSASLIKAIREELLRLSQKQAAVSSYHS
uniref:KIAA1549 ortholog n=1 Tax=Mastacembelus armatus TaxID=205130 RepID=A0A7N8Y2W2_9TELE